MAAGADDGDLRVEMAAGDDAHDVNGEDLSAVGQCAQAR
jgi:hypothetical protein